MLLKEMQIDEINRCAFTKHILCGARNIKLNFLWLLGSKLITRIYFMTVLFATPIIMEITKKIITHPSKMDTVFQNFIFYLKH